MSIFYVCISRLSEWSAVDHLSFFISTGVVYEYLSAVLSDVLHSQREPLPLCLALLQYDKELVSSELSASPHPSIIHFHQYYSKWLPQQCQEELVSFLTETRDCLTESVTHF